MNLETYTKVAIIFGIAIACVLTGIVLSYSIGDVLNIYDVGDEIRWALTDKNEIITQMKNSTSYVSFIDRFPNYREEIVENRYEIELQIETINRTTMNVLELTFVYSEDHSIIREDTRCYNLNNMGNHVRVFESAFTDVYIEKTNCLEDDYKNPRNSIFYDEWSN